MLRSIDDVSSAGMSYFASCVGFISHLDLMAIGAAVLLIARLCIDLPKAFIAIRRLFRDKGK